MNSRMKPETIRSIIGQITYRPGYRLHITERDDDTLCLQAIADVLCVKTGEVVQLASHPHTIWPILTETGLVRLAFTVFKEIEEHEMQEWFRYQDRRVFNPHTDIRTLWEVCEKEG